LLLIGKDRSIIIEAVVQTRTSSSLSSPRLDHRAVADCTNTGECMRVGACVAVIGALALLFIADFGALEGLSALGSSVAYSLSRLLYGIGSTG